MKTFRRITVAVIVVAVAIQLVPISRTNPPVETEVAAPYNVQAIITRSCYDCHSNETVWPWYSHVAPVSWVVVYDVREGRTDLNFSEWGSYSIKEKGDKLDDICGRVRRDEMPDGKYTLIHRNARLSNDERNAVCAWAEQVRKRLDTSTPASNSPQ